MKNRLSFVLLLSLVHLVACQSDATSSHTSTDTEAPTQEQIPTETPETSSTEVAHETTDSLAPPPGEGVAMFRTHMEPDTYKKTGMGLGKPETAGVSESISQELEMGAAAYGQKKYEQAIAHFERFAKARPSNLQVPYYIGISYLAQEKIDQAEPHFLKLLERQDALYHEHAQWYLALIHLYRGNYNASELMLSQIVETDWHYFNDRARTLLGQVRAMRQHLNQ